MIGSDPVSYDYIETRFALLTQKAADDVAALTLRITDALEAMDLRLEQRFQAQSKALDAAFAARQEATQISLVAAEKSLQIALVAADKEAQKVERTYDKRFDSVNEFRQTLADQQRNLIDRREVEAITNAIEIRLVAQTKIIDGMTSERIGIKGGWGYAAAVVGFFMALLSGIGVVWAILN